MLVACPTCRTKIRLTDFSHESRVIPYLCGECGEIVRLDLVLDEIPRGRSAASLSRMRTPLVLLAEADPAVRAVAAELLRHAGYRIREAADGLTARDEIRRLHPDLVVADVSLPGLNGVELLRELRADSRLGGTPVLVLSRVVKPALIEALRSAGADGFLERDRLVDTLAFRVEAALASTHGTPAL